jgi:dipeptidase E
VRTGAIPPGYAADDGVALVFRGHEVDEVVSAREKARAYEVTAAGERPLEPRVLAQPPTRAASIQAVAELRRLRLARPAD